MRQVIPAFLWFSAIGCGLMAGVYFAFSTFVMTGFARISPAAAIAAMNSINIVIVRSLFMPLFMATSLTAAVLAVFALVRWTEPAALPMLLGGLIYVVGMFAVTAVFNVPLNDGLAGMDPATPAGLAAWKSYLRDWTLWNHVRTVASTLSAILFTAAIAAR